MRKAKPLKPPRKSDVEATIDACLANASRLMDDALMLEFQERGGGRLAICMLAQEEYAKAFLLYMVREELLPWDTDLLGSRHSARDRTARRRHSTSARA